ncbi:MAG TPA: hypothetical protein VLB84_10460 [Bacteroidia bacterium]|nr:hypothetical protein [Bacteroidia bacterium]
MSKNQNDLKKKTSNKTLAPSTSMSLLEKLDTWFEKHDKKMFYFVLIASTLVSLLLFDSKVSPGGDDSSYIERAWSFLHEGKYPYFQGPAYPVFLSLFVKIFGLNVIVLKFVSILCQLGFVFFTYKAFVKRIPYTVLYALLFYISFNHFIQYYSSQTFTETFFLFLQSIAIYLTFKLIDSVDFSSGWMEGFKKNYGKWLVFGAMFVLLSLAKSVAFACIIGVFAYFILRKEYKAGVYALLGFFIIRIVYQVICTSVFGPNTSGQLELLLRKDLYKPEGGYEDFAGMITRFFDNFNTYISLHMYRLMNLRKSDTLLSIPALSYISAIVLGICIFIAYKKNKFIFFSGIYFILLCVGIFFGIQASNMQDRLIIIIIHLIFLVLFYGFYEIVRKYQGIQYVFVIFSAIMLVRTVFITLDLANENAVTLKKNLSGDIYYGYTPDWENFLKMSKYCADSIPDNMEVLSRKPNMSFIYGKGRNFVGQYITNTTDADSVLAIWKSENVHYIMLPKLRRDPRKNNGEVINTIHRMLGPVYQKYPEKVSLVKTIGTQESCELYKITY